MDKILCKRATTNKMSIKDRRLSFYASVFDQPTVVKTERSKPYTEVIRKGAFKKSLSDPNQEVVATLFHNMSRTFASKQRGELYLEEDDYGLFTTTYLPKGEIGDSVQKFVDNELLTECSCQFYTHDTGSDFEERTEADLFEVTLIPAGKAIYPGTRIMRGESIDKELQRLSLWFRLLKIKTK